MKPPAASLRSGGFALAAHVLDREQEFLAVGAHAERDEQGNGRRLFVEPHAHDRSVENEPEDRFLGERALVPDVSIALNLMAQCGRPDYAQHDSGP